jgi:hypothetical protein
MFRVLRHGFLTGPGLLAFCHPRHPVVTPLAVALYLGQSSAEATAAAGCPVASQFSLLKYCHYGRRIPENYPSRTTGNQQAVNIIP